MIKAGKKRKQINIGKPFTKAFNDSLPATTTGETTN